MKKLSWYQRLWERFVNAKCSNSELISSLSLCDLMPLGDEAPYKWNDLEKEDTYSSDTPLMFMLVSLRYKVRITFSCVVNQAWNEGRDEDENGQPFTHWMKYVCIDSMSPGIVIYMNTYAWKVDMDDFLPLIKDRIKTQF
jgi:hypothetical protein